MKTLVEVLINDLQTYQAQNMPYNSDTTVDLATPEDGAGPVPVVDAIELSDTA